MEVNSKTLELVMLVDDNDTDNFISKRIIEITSFAKMVIVKSSGKSALDYLEEKKDSGLCEINLFERSLCERFGYEFYNIIVVDDFINIPLVVRA